LEGDKNSIGRRIGDRSGADGCRGDRFLGQLAADATKVLPIKKIRVAIFTEGQD
jgi:hypothetical protein